MAPATDDSLDGDEKSIFQCLDAARYVVAAVVTVLIVAVIVYAIKVVLRPADMYLLVAGGSVSVEPTDNLTKPFNASVGGDSLTFSFTLQAFNPSGRVRIYYTDVSTSLWSTNSSGKVNGFLTPVMGNVTLKQQLRVDTVVQLATTATAPFQEEYFKLLANGSSIDDATLMLNGTRTVEVYSGHNVTDAVPAIYYCSPIVVGGEKDDDSTAPADVRCMKNLPTINQPDMS